MEEARQVLATLNWSRSSTAAELGNLDAMSELACCFRDGEGTTVDYAQAMRWVRRAADQGDAHAMNTVANLYAHGQGVPVDSAESVRWFERAAAAGSDGAKNNLRDLAAAGFAPAAAALRRLGLE